MKKLMLLGTVALSLALFAPESRASSVCTSVAGNLVANCAFGTGDFTSWTTTGVDVTNGQLGNLYGVEQGADPTDGISPPNGETYQAYFADIGNPTTISQSILTTASDTYTISFFLAQDTALTSTNNPNNEYPNDLVVSFAGTMFNMSDVALTNGYVPITLTAVATSGSSVLSFALQNDLGEFLLDDISVTQNAPPTPEPSSLLLLATGLAGVGGAVRRRFSR